MSRTTTPKNGAAHATTSIPSDRLLDEELNFYLPLIEVSLQLPRVLSAKSERAIGVTFTEAGAIAYLHAAGSTGISMSELSQKLNLSNSRVTRLVNDLEHAGLVVRRKSKSDGRSNIVKLTDKGRKRVLEQRPFHLANIRENCIQVFSKRERQLLLPYLERLRAHLASES